MGCGGTFVPNYDFIVSQSSAERYFLALWQPGGRIVDFGEEDFAAYVKATAISSLLGVKGNIPSDRKVSVF
jgi:hypothetical protein